MERFSTASIDVVRPVVALLFVAAVWRAAAVPLSTAEAIAWERAVRPPLREVLVTPGVWSELLYGLLAKRTAGLFRLSELSLRLPGLLGCLTGCAVVLAAYLCHLFTLSDRAWPSLLARARPLR